MDCDLAADKVPPIIIEKSKIPHSVKCLNVGKLPISYIDQQNEWLKKFNCQFDKVLFPYDLKVNDDKHKKTYIG